ncbi:MFS transporter [Photobacterium galatheae]|uniref:MFS transporter n=1 Tax=Photobacterium galatheae TaxID=1654360 RepID=A0A066RT62_9GAMM|nr:MFS transporter [Photobacterium galatheae]KDM92281.1 MFS transporter [Photobacterium galatheae]MCM0150538.1 MFS transporter [Photobacterium galatheae]
MPNPYQSLFSTPGALAFTLPGLIARMPTSMAGIGIITMLSQLSGSYWLAGAVAATFTLTMAIIAPQISRAVDRYGQRKILPYAAGLSVAALILLLVSVRLDAPIWTYFLFAALAGFMPSMPAMIRARWTTIYKGDEKLHTAYAFESVMDEVCFIIGPPLAVGLCVSVAPEAGPFAAAVLLGIGVTLFVRQTQTEPPIQDKTDTKRDSALKPLPMKMLMLTLLALGTIVGTVDVISVAFAEQQGEPVAASYVLSAYAAGSCLSGLLFGTLKLKTHLRKQLLLAALATAFTTLPLMLVTGTTTLAVSVFIAGVFFAPTMIVTMGLVEQIVPASQLTEGFTWMITGLGIGIAAGAAGVGWMIDEYGIQAGFTVTMSAGLAVFLIALLCYRLLRPALHAQPVSA